MEGEESKGRREETVKGTIKKMNEMSYKIRNSEGIPVISRSIIVYLT